MSELILSGAGAQAGDEMILNMGPQHPSTHGVIRFIVRTDGEVMSSAEPDVGYLHRAIEHIAEKCTYEGFMPYTDRVDYVCAMTANHAWASAVEKLGQLPVPPRAHHLRVISDELNRISSHCIALGAMAMDLGAVTPFPYALREREHVNDLLEELCGARLTYNYHRIGGVGWDLTDAWRDKVLRFLDHFEPVIAEFDRLITHNEIFVRRLGGLAPIDRDEAIAYGLVGPNLRASGVAFDVRADLPYATYPTILPKIGWRTPVGRGQAGRVGDAWDRFWLRVEEWRWSVRIVREALNQIQDTPRGEILIAPKRFRPKGDALARVEAARGDMACYVVGDGGPHAYRARFRTGSFNAMGLVRKKSRGLMVADLVALIASLDIVAPEIDPMIRRVMADGVAMRTVAACREIGGPDGERVRARARARVRARVRVRARPAGLGQRPAGSGHRETPAAQRDTHTPSANRTRTRTRTRARTRTRSPSGPPRSARISRQTVARLRLALGALALWAALAAAGANAANAAALAGVRDLSPTKLERGDRLVVELDPGAGAPRGPAFILLRRPAPSPVTLALKGRALGDGRVIADIDAAVEARVGRDVRWTNVTVEVALTDTGTGDIWAATGGQRVWRSAPGDGYDLSFFPRTLRALAADTAARFRPVIAGHRVPAAGVTLAVMVGVTLLILLLVAPATGVLVVWERKIAGRMQSRFGPNRVGPSGWLQWLADALKLIRKEDLIPTDADPILFRLAPYLVWASIFATFVVLPLSEFAIVADLDIGVLYLSSVTTFTVIGIVMGGWASNSKWSLLGGMRSAAQIISYELPASIALLAVVVAAGTLAPQAIVRAQGGLPTDWFVFRSPFTFVAFIVYFISALAEGNRTPFDLPEAESELVAGFSTEYSGFRWSIFSLGEWTNIYVMGAIVTTVFLGGWNVPFVSAEAVAASSGWRVVSMAMMLGKVVALSFMVIWIRWSLPRLRVDQMMSLCWKWLLPVALCAFMGSALWTWVEAVAPRLGTGVRWATFLIGGVAWAVAFAVRVVRTFRATPLLHAGQRQFTLPFFERRLEKR